MALPGLSHRRSLPMYACHAVAVIAPFFVTFAWRYVALALVLYAVRMFALSAGYHRYFAHRSFKTSRAFQLLLALSGGTCTQRGALWWAANHRHHHLHSDGVEDIHSPVQGGVFWSHLGWVLSKRFERTRHDRIRDFAKVPELRWLDEHHFVPSLVFAASLLALGGPSALVWGCFVLTVLLWHGTFAINSLAHLFGHRRYATHDASRNSFLLAFVTLGEGWHNNHHHCPSSAALGFYWWEIDITYYGLRALRALGIVWDLRRPPEAVRDA